MGMLLNKELCANGISLRVETRIALVDEKYLKTRQSNFPWPFLRRQSWFSLRTFVSPRAVLKSL